MKISLKLWFGLGMCAGCLLGASAARAAVSLSISPATITNDYTGNITFTIMGLTNSQQVQLIRFYDANGNGVLDAQELPVQNLRLADGQLPILGGIRNLNVPGDDDGLTNGQILMRLAYPGLDDVIGGMSGNFIFRVEDKTGTPLADQFFSVKQKVLAQGVRGTVIAAGGGVVSNTPVALIDVNNDGNPQISLTDATGNYGFYAPTGSYAVAVVGNSFVSDLQAGFATVPAGQLVTNNLAPASGAYVISGYLTDSANGKPLGTVFVNGQSTDNLFSGTFTDTNGFYSFPVSAGQWKVTMDEGALNQRGYLALQNSLRVTVTNSGITNLNFTPAKATALIYGTVRDSQSNAVSGLAMTADDDLNLYEAASLTDTNGAYTLGVVAGNWNEGPSGGALTARGYSGGNSVFVTVTNGQAVAADFVVSGVTAHLRGLVKDDHGNPIANIQIVVQPYPLMGNGANSIYLSTDGSGNFDAGVSAGTWNIALECVSAQSRGYVDISGLNYSVTDGVDQNGLTLTFPQATAVISGRITDTGGHPIQGVTLNANQNISANSSYFPGCVSTDNNGNYQIQVLGGTWQMSVQNNDLTGLGYNPVSSTNVTILAGAATANFVASAMLTAPQFIGGGYSLVTGASLVVSGDIGRTNIIQFTTNFVNWFTLTNMVLTNATWQVSDPAGATQRARFYRALVLP